VLGNNADVAHNTENMFEPAHEVIAAEIPGIAFIQLHGNQSSTCDHLTGQPGVVLAAFVSNGTTTPGPRVNQVVDCVNIGPFVAEAATAGSECVFRGTTNIQGRFSNGSPDLCSQGVDAASENFIHIEQSQRSAIRDPANRQALIDALRCALVPRP
jgi:hypothetical protein